ncbi:hypothetical protein CDAR_484561 [Caerostris darwini]|uniref:Ycf15 n=1 Tax=Caerostris darwini TaxID=1538125 RepID=A0AAV4MIG2_9ARAC|nr:hypothetical protein CDAR_484561 [Caerostris darwini]
MIPLQLYKKKKILILDSIEYPESFYQRPCSSANRKKKRGTDIIYCNEEMISSGNSLRPYRVFFSYYFPLSAGHRPYLDRLPYSGQPPSLSSLDNASFGQHSDRISFGRESVSQSVVSLE